MVETYTNTMATIADTQASIRDGEIWQDRDGGPHSVISERKKEVQPLSVKELLAQLDGVFPMDQAVVEGMLHPRPHSLYRQLTCISFVYSTAGRGHFYVGRAFWYERLDGDRKGHDTRVRWHRGIILLEGE